MEKITNYLKLTIYKKGGSSFYCDYYFYNGISHEEGTTKAGGYGYDKTSTVASNAINNYNFLYNIKQGTKWEGKNSMHSQTKKGLTVYGVYNNKDISYGIGLSSVLNCLNVFSNVKINSTYYGENETQITLKISTTQKQLQKIIEKNNKTINNKKSDKNYRKKAKEENEKIKKLFNLEKEV